MSLRDIFRSLHLIVGALHDAHFPLGLIFPLNLSLSIWPPVQNIYLKFPPASEAKPVAAPAAWLKASKTMSHSCVPSHESCDSWGSSPGYTLAQLDHL